MATWWQQCEADMRSHLEKTGYFTNLTAVKCCCGACGDTPPEDLDAFDYENGEVPYWYECDFCKRTVPYCFGQDDDLFEFCDDCAMAWFELMERQGDLSKRVSKMQEVAA